MYDYIRPQKLFEALRFLKANNPLYDNIDIHEEWVEEAIGNDEELCQYLIEQGNEQMDTECESGTAGAASSEPIVAMECSSGSDEFSRALHQLKASKQLCHS